MNTNTNRCNEVCYSSQGFVFLILEKIFEDNKKALKKVSAPIFILPKWMMTILVVLSFAITGSSQIVAIIGYNGTSPDGISVVALQDIPGGTIIFFTENEHIGGGIFNTGEGRWSWESPIGGIAKGDVIVMTEGGSGTGDNTIVVTCGTSPCGTATVWETPIALASTGESVYAFSDSDTDATNGTLEIYSVFVSDGALPLAENPLVFSPNAIIVDGLSITNTHAEYSVALRTPGPITKADLENPTKYTEATGFVDLSTAPFVGIDLGPPSGPELDVRNNVDNADIFDGSINVSVALGTDFGSVYASSGSSSSTFRAENNGTSMLTFGVTALTISNTIDFSITTSLTNNGTVAVGGVETFTIVFDPATIGTKTCTVTIRSDDPNEDPYTFEIQGVGNPEPTRKWLIVGRNDTDLDGFSIVCTEDVTSADIVYITDDEYDSATNKFVTGESVTKYTPPAGGHLKGEVISFRETMPNSDIAEIVGCTSGTCGTIANLGSGNFAIGTNDELYAYSDSDDNSGNGVTEIYCVWFWNGGEDPGEDPTGDFPSAQKLNFPGDPFSIDFKDALRGSDVTATIYNDIANSYDLSGANEVLSLTRFAGVFLSSSSPEMDITDASGDPINSGSNLAGANTTNSTDFGYVCEAGAASASFTYTITNSGNADLDFTGSPLVSLIGGNSGDFSVTSQIALDPLPSIMGNTTTFTVSFNPSAVGQRSTTVSISNNDGDEDPYTFVIKGEGVAISLSENHVNVMCNGGATGSIDLAVSGGVTPYTYAWTGGASTEDISNIAAGSYTVLVTDVNFCTNSLSTIITEPMASNNIFIGTDNDWLNPSNWSEGCLPSFPISVTLTLSQDVNLMGLGAIEVANGGSIVINAGVTFIVDEPLTINSGGSIINNGTLHNMTEINYSGSFSNSGLYKGIGDFNGAFINNGSVSPGN